MTSVLTWYDASKSCLVHVSTKFEANRSINTVAVAKKPLKWTFLRDNVATLLRHDVNSHMVHCAYTMSMSLPKLKQICRKTRPQWPKIRHSAGCVAAPRGPGGQVTAPHVMLLWPGARRGHGGGTAAALGSAPCHAARRRRRGRPSTFCMTMFYTQKRTTCYYPLLPVTTRCSVVTGSNGCQLADTRYYLLLPVDIYPDPVQEIFMFCWTKQCLIILTDTC